MTRDQIQNVIDEEVLLNNMGHVIDVYNRFQPTQDTSEWIINKHDYTCDQSSWAIANICN